VAIRRVRRISFPKLRLISFCVLLIKYQLAVVVLLREECAVATDAQAKISRVNIAFFMIFSHPITAEL
jgi:hypothetical protein